MGRSCQDPRDSDITASHFIRHRLTHALHLLKRCLLSHVVQAPGGFITQSNLTRRNVRLELKPGPQRGINDAHGSTLSKAPFIYNHICLHANFSFGCHAVHFLWLCPECFLNFLNDRSTEPTNFTMFTLTCQVTDRSLCWLLKFFSQQGTYGLWD